MAKLGDGWLPNYATAADAREALAYLKEQLSRDGRKMTDFGIEPRLRYSDGNADVWQKIVADWTTAGATHFTLNTMYRGFDTPQKHLRAMRDFAEQMLG
jgi:alkanesulfonate monooxygenase SsuD/methylene tetrahydromethanopterin reductase-like flavin-dependent oxidoreductase (luciferase family)